MTAAQQAFETRRQEILKTRGETAAAAATATLNVEVKGALPATTKVTCDGKDPKQTAGRFFLFEGLTQGQHLVAVAVEADAAAKPPTPAKSAVRAVAPKGGVNDLLIEPS